MTEQNFLGFLLAVRQDPDMLARYDGRNLSQLLFHARNEGHAFLPGDIEQVVGRLEVGVITTKDGEPVDGDSRLWRSMWGRRHLDYLVHHVLPRYTAPELAALGAGPATEGEGL